MTTDKRRQVWTARATTASCLCLAIRAAGETNEHIRVHLAQFRAWLTVLVLLPLRRHPSGTRGLGFEMQADPGFEWMEQMVSTQAIPSRDIMTDNDIREPHTSNVKACNHQQKRLSSHLKDILANPPFCLPWQCRPLQSQLLLRLHRPWLSSCAKASAKKQLQANPISEPPSDQNDEKVGTPSETHQRLGITKLRNSKKLESPGNEVSETFKCSSADASEQIPALEHQTCPSSACRVWGEGFLSNSHRESQLCRRKVMDAKDSFR